MRNLDLSLWVMVPYLVGGVVLQALGLGLAVAVHQGGRLWRLLRPFRRRGRFDRLRTGLAWALVLVGASTVQLGVVIEMVRHWA